MRGFGDSERVANAAIARLREQSERTFAGEERSGTWVGNVEEAHAALDSIQDKDDMDYQTARLSLYLYRRDYSGAKAFAAKATTSKEDTDSGTPWQQLLMRRVR